MFAWCSNYITQEWRNIFDQLPQGITNAVALKLTDVINKHNLFTI